MSEIRLEDISINSLKETHHPDSKYGPAQDHANSLQQSSSSRATAVSGSSESGQPSANSQNVQKAKDKTDKEIANLASIILTEKEPASKLKFANENVRPARARRAASCR